MKTNWDIFCCVVDNFGDIGVTWRLAKQLVTEHKQNVRLWVDDLPSFARLCPDIDINATVQTVHNIEVNLWSKNTACFKENTFTVGNMVIEAFGCELPSEYVAAMVLQAAKGKSPLWLNLEYLSAESWVEGCHGLPSLQANGLQKFFFFPGFTEKTGGLIREENLINSRIAFQQSPENKQRFLQSLGVTYQENTRLISLFAYENLYINNWLNALANPSNKEQKTHLLIPDGRIVPQVATWLNEQELQLGKTYQRGALTLQKIPFITQENYDYLLWSCDFNVVRGEDSFIRAQWAAKPFLWHIYPQEENTHLIKLDAFLALYTQNMPLSAKNALTTQWQTWNQATSYADKNNALIATNWLDIEEQWEKLAKHAQNWCQQQTKHKNLSTALMQFYLNWL